MTNGEIVVHALWTILANVMCTPDYENNDAMTYNDVQDYFYKTI